MGPRRLDRYLFSEILGPLALGFLVYTFILLLQFLFQSAEMIIRRGLDWAIVGQLLLLNLPHIVVLTIPMALLFAILIAVGRLSADSELVALRSCGVSLLSLYRPVLLLSGLLTAFNLYLMISVLPAGNHALQQLRLAILTQTVARQVEPRVFYEEWEPFVIYVFEILPGEQRWRGVFVAEALPGSQNEVTVAEWGELRVDESGDKVVLMLGNAVSHKVDFESPDRYEVSRNERLIKILQDDWSTAQRAKVSITKGIRELTLAELRQTARNPEASQELRNLARVELQKKFSIPAACLVFGLVALPLGIANRRGTKASGFALSLGVIMVYWVLLNHGEESARMGQLAPGLAMWAPNLLLAVAGLFLLARRNRDKSLMLSRLDRWVRKELWSGLLHLERLHRGRRERRSQRRGRFAPDLVLKLPRPRLRFPNLLDRYVIRLYLGILLLVVLSGVCLYIVADLTQIVDEILKHRVPRGVVLDYYKFLTLQIVYEISPVMVLVATLITFSLLSRSNEITALKSLGTSLYRLSLPAIAATLLVVLASIYLQSEILPATNQRVAQTKDRIMGRDVVRTYRRADRQWLFGQGRFIYNYLRYDRDQAELQRLQVFRFDPVDYHLTGRLVADRVRHRDGRWLFDHGWGRSFDAAQLTTEYLKFAEPLVVDFPESPEYFESELRPPEQMRFQQLKAYIEELRGSGQVVPELEVELHKKLSFPMISLVMALVALPFAFRLGRQGALYGIGLSIVIGIAFYTTFVLFTTLGETAVLPPLVAVWSPNLVFGLLAVYLFLGVRT